MVVVGRRREPELADSRHCRGTAGSVGGSGGVVAFEYFFHRLTEPFQNTGNTWFYWDRASPVYPQGTLGYRRAFFSKPLILSSGPDQQLGIFLLYPSARVPEPDHA